MIGRPSQKYGSGQRPSWRCGTGWDTLPEVRKWSGDPPDVQELIGKPSRRFGTGPETLPEVRNWLGDTPKGPEVVGDPPGGVELVGDPFCGVELVGRPSRWCGTDWETLPRSLTSRETL